MFVSPAEHHPLLRGLGEVSPEVEKRGADFLWIGQGGLWAAQRKEVKDLRASLGDRLARELPQMAGSDLVRAFLIVEGPVTDVMTWAQWVGLSMSVQVEWGIGVVTTVSVAQTAETLRRMESWSQKSIHGSLSQRSKSRAVWGSQRSREWGIHLLQSFDGLSVGRAGAIYDHFGHVPLTWTCSDDEMDGVPGIGKKTRVRLMDALAYTDPESNGAGEVRG